MKQGATRSVLLGSLAVSVVTSLAFTGLGAPVGQDPTRDPDGTPTREPLDPPPPNQPTLAVDNSGPEIGISLTRRTREPLGPLTITIAATGANGRERDFVAELGHGRARFTADGRRWICRDRRITRPGDKAGVGLVIPRTCLGGAATLRVSTAVSGQPLAVTQQRRVRPNVLMIMLDDARDDQLSRRWMPRTMDLLADQGVRFTNSFAPFALCAPSRASMLSGQYATGTGIWSIVQPWGFSSFADRQTLPVWLDRAGYRTMMLGKYINGYESSSDDTSVDVPWWHYRPPGWDEWHASGTGTYNYLRTDLAWARDGMPGKRRITRYQTTAYGSIARSMIDSAVGDRHPFFFYLNFTAPHAGYPVRSPGRGFPRSHGIVTPYVPPNVVGSLARRNPTAPGLLGPQDPMTGKPSYMSRRPITGGYRLAVNAGAQRRNESLYLVDRQVARVIQSLKDTGAYDNTYVMLTSDNGYFAGEHRKPQRKTLPYDPAIRVPMVIAGPGIPKGATRRTPISTVDIAPTVLGMTGVRAPSRVRLDGSSRFGVATGDAADVGWTHPLMLLTGPFDFDIRNPLLQTVAFNPDAPNALSAIQGVRTSRYVYLVDRTGFEQLYDRLTPLGRAEITNVAGEPRYAQALAASRRLLNELRHCAGASCRPPIPRILR